MLTFADAGSSPISRRLKLSSDAAPTVLMKQAPYDKMIEAFDERSHYAADVQILTMALTDALASDQVYAGI